MAIRSEITQLLAAARRGEAGVLDRLMPLVYDELHTLAHSQLQRRRPGETLNTTAVVHEAYLKLVRQSQAEWQDRTHFFAVAAVAMRHILVDYARRKTARKRGGDDRPIVFDEAQMGVEPRAAEVLALDEALSSLAVLNERLSKVVELRFFGGLTVEETAAVLGTSERTVKRDWRKSRAYLFRELSERGLG